jgi:hypothetical protein
VSVGELLAAVTSNKVTIQSRVPATAEVGGVQNVVENGEGQGTQAVKCAGRVSTTSCFAESRELRLILTDAG